jgi:putative oxidoreductase
MKTKYSQWGALLLRLIIGFGAMAHGYAKLSRGPAGFEKLLVQIGVPFPHLTSWIVPLTEVAAGICVFIGAFVSIAAIPLIFTMIVAMFSIHIHNGFSSLKTIGLTANGPVFGPPGYEINLLYIAGLASIILTGAGIYSVDSLIDYRKNNSGRHKGDFNAPTGMLTENSIVTDSH